MRGFTKRPGLVPGESCLVRVLNEVPKGVDYTGAQPPNALFQRLHDASVVAMGDKRAEGGWHVTARLLGADLQEQPIPGMRGFYDREPAPFVYEVVPREGRYLNGLTREEGIRLGDSCFIWVKADGLIPWLEQDPDDRPSVPRGYPVEHLVGFWRGRVTAILKARDGSPVRKLRAVIVDPRILGHRLPAVSQLHGHEPWIPYSVTLTDNEIAEAGSEMIDDLAEGAKRLARHLDLPDWLRRPRSGGNVWSPEDFDV